MLMTSTQQVARNMTRKWPDDEIPALYTVQVAAAEALAQSVPAYILHICITGTFWEKIERVLHESRATNSPLCPLYRPQQEFRIE